MVRAAVVVAVTIFSLAIYLLVGVAAVEPIAEEVKRHDSIDSVNGTSAIDGMMEVLFKWVPLLLGGGIMLWGVVWYFRRERFTGRRGF